MSNIPAPAASAAATLELDSAAVTHHVDAIRAWERHLRSRLSTSERLSAWVARTVGRGGSLALHAAWFTTWIAVNTGWAGLPVFDPYPYPLLTLTVSLEAIFLSLFVLASQNRMADIADKRSHLDLQIDLLAEREMTALLQMVCAISQRLDVPTGLTDAQMRDFTTPTNLTGLAAQLESLDPE